MTRLSDLLRGAADRAPVGDASVAVDRVSRRVRLNRGMRAAGNGAVGVGAAALLAVTFVLPGAAMTANSSDSFGPAAAPEAGGAVKANDDSALLANPTDRAAEWGMCGSFPLQDYGYGATDRASVAASFDASSEPEAGSTVDVGYSITADDDVEAATNGPDVVVLWDGMVVARASGEDAATAVTNAANDVSGGTVALPLVDCFRGDPLPPSKYEIVVSQGFANRIDVAEPTPLPSTEPAPSSSASPSPAASPRLPETPLPVDPSLVAAPDDRTTSGNLRSDPVVEPDIAPMPVEPYGWDFRVTSEPIGFAVAGDPVDNPFADYFPQPWTPPAQPDDILTPEQARLLFDAHASSIPWSMAPGTSRWILPNGGGGRETFAPEQNYYGCSWDGTTGLTFPTRSADLGLVSTTATIPDRISVSYGWVVDGNPEVTLSVTNTSDYSIPGFYGEPNRSLYLVKDGRVVAQAYPVSVDPNGGRLYAADGVAASTPADDPDRYWGTLAPGERVSGTYLWRDVSTCSGEDGTQTSLRPGTYTLLAMQSISLQSYGTSVGVPIPEPMRDAAVVYSGVAPDSSQGVSGTTEGSGGATASRASAIAPVPPDEQDWLEIQVWTSLGSVTITTH
jgi:hypothetical protein